MPGRIFISYRRQDAAGDAGRLADHLYRRFGPDRVFLDIDAIDPGTDFVRVLQSSLGETAAVLVVIGPRWLALTDEHGARRIDDPNDFVRMEVEAALSRGVPVVPVLVQGAAMPRPSDLPAPLSGLVTRQAAALDHSEFHADAERLCDRLARVMGEAPLWRTAVRRAIPAAIVVFLVAAAVGGYYATREQVDDQAAAASPPLGTATRDDGTAAAPLPASPSDGSLSAAEDALRVATQDAERNLRAEALLIEASLQRRRGQLLEALATLTRARAAAPASPAVRDAQEDAAMDWIRNVRVEDGKSSFTEAIKPAMTVVDAAIPGAAGTRRADLLAHSGWATFLMWRDGNRQLDPAEWYREALSIDAANPYANAMLAHWLLFRDDDVAKAATLFATALESGRARDAVRRLQWAGYGNSNAEEATAERIRLADAMRREGEKLTTEQAGRLWSAYFFALPPQRERARQTLFTALPPDDHVATLAWAFDDYVASDPSRQQIRRYWSAVLTARAGRTRQAATALLGLEAELAKSPGSLRDAVQTTLKRLQ